MNRACILAGGGAGALLHFTDSKSECPGSPPMREGRGGGGGGMTGA